MYGEKIKEIRRELGLSQKEFSEKLGISTMALSRLETNDSSLKVELLSKIEGLGISLDWLVVNRGEMFGNPQSSIVEEKKTFSVPMFDIQASAGSGIFNEGNDLIIGAFELGEEFRKYWGKDVGVIRVTGDSMEPTIPRNSWVFVRKKQEIRSEGIFIFVHNNELRCKRIFKEMSGQLHIISDNQIYPEEVYTADDSIIAELIVVAEVICTLNEI